MKRGEIAGFDRGSGGAFGEGTPTPLKLGRWWRLLSVWPAALLLVGCASPAPSYPPPGYPAYPPYANAPPPPPAYPTYAPPPPHPAAPPPSAPPRSATIADAVTACNRVQSAANIPIGCTVERVDGVTAMVIAFKSQSDAGQYLGAMVDNVAGPFCEAADAANRQAAVYVLVASRWAKRFDCELQRWVDVELPNRQPAEPAQNRAAPERVLTLDEAIAVCQRIKGEASIPISCDMNYVEGVPAIFLGFRNEQESQQYIQPMAKYVAGPFCVAAVEQGSHGVVFMVLLDETPRRARRYSCDTQRWTDWAVLPAPTSQTTPVQPAEHRRTRRDAF